MSREKPLLQFRTEIFDHAIFPCPQRLNSTSIINVVKSLYLMSSLDGKISVQHWAEVAIKQLSLTIQEAEVYFEVFRTLTQERRTAHPVIDLK